MQRRRDKGLGRAIENNRKKRIEPGPGPATARTTGVADKQGARSVLEQSSLDDFIATAELARHTFAVERGREFEVVHGPQVVEQLSGAARSQAESAAAASRVHVPIPRRPAWNEDTTADELCAAEGEAFVAWRKSLARLEEEEGLVMTPYERNLDFWRQLWRCVERSSLLVQILDARDPEFYRCHDLERYVQDSAGSKQAMLLVNKADFLSADMRREWASYFRSRGVDFIFFSALRELKRQAKSAAHAGRLEEDNAALPTLPEKQEAEQDEQEEEEEEQEQPEHVPQDASKKEVLSGPEGEHLDDETDIADCHKLLEEIHTRLGITSNTALADEKAPIVGFVGYPNVGKSSVINALVGAKKVSMSRTPGKTKHLQTLELSDWGLTLCDCPGLVFPSVVATKAHLVTNGVVPLDEVRDFMPAVLIALQKLGPPRVLERFGLPSVAAQASMRSKEVTTEIVHAVLSAIASHRQHFLAHGVADESKAARRLLRDYVTGAIPYCEPPPSRGQKATDHHQEAPSNEADDDDDDFDDLGDFLEGRAPGRTKRAERQANKKASKGGRNSTLVQTS
mmetsp:Transcript_34737/g.77988  ORF Transcript_34737/g.77988 Transcript_34737/m.77988 type:complete len:568 (-) Transcript_34737:74-1777(-)